MNYMVGIYFVCIVTFLQTMDQATPEVKIAWSYPLKISPVSLEQAIEQAKNFEPSFNQRFGKIGIGITSDWKFNYKQYETCIAIPRDFLGQRCQLCYFKAHEFIYNPEQCLAVILKDRYKTTAETYDEVWCLYTILQNIPVNSTLRAIEIKLLKRLPRFAQKVIDARSAQDGKSILFLFEDSTRCSVSPEECPFKIKNTRCKKLADIFFEFV